MNLILTGSDYNEPINVGPIDLDPLYREPTLLSHSTQSVTCSKLIFHNYCAIMYLISTGSDYNEPINAGPISLEPLDRMPTLLSRTTQCVTCSKPIFNNCCAIMNVPLTGSDNLGPIYHRDRASRCSAHRSIPSR